MIDHNRTGRYYEVLFKAECLKRNLEVLSPECSHLPFDLAIFSNGRFLRIQVKGTTSLQKNSGQKKRGGRDFYRIPMKQKKGGATYSDCGVDFVAGYIPLMGKWFIIPASYSRANSFRIGKNLDSKGAASQFCERWDLLGAVTSQAEPEFD